MAIRQQTSKTIVRKSENMISKAFFLRAVKLSFRLFRKAFNKSIPIVTISNMYMYTISPLGFIFHGNNFFVVELEKKKGPFYYSQLL